MNKRIIALTVILIIALSIALVSVTNLVDGQVSVGVKVGDWMEYNVVAGGNPPAAQDITWAKIEIIDVEGQMFHANFTVRYVNGTMSSSVRAFDFSTGNVEAWIIIPANLSPDKSFYDSSINTNVTIQGQVQKTVAGATRTVTYTDLSTPGLDRHKEWDKATGFYIQSVDNVTTYTINANAYATNIWSPQILGLDQTVFYTIITVAIVVVIFALAIVILLRKRPRRGTV